MMYTRERLSNKMRQIRRDFDRQQATFRWPTTAITAVLLVVVVRGLFTRQETMWPPSVVLVCLTVFVLMTVYQWRLYRKQRDLNR
jgi:ABC-type transport system involved in Fe-S cluster assembly fused permease/ATPase subunit